MNRDLGFVIVGCGMIARVHARALAEVAGARLVGLVSRSTDAATKMATELDRPDLAVFTSLEKAVEQPGVDVVIITTPSGAHLEPGIVAARAGKHVIVEKPLEVTVERCDALIEACNRYGVLLGAIFPSRFGDANRELKAAVEAGRFGRLTLAETACKWWRSQAYYDDGGWKGTKALDGGGALMNQAIHNVDLLLWLMGPVHSVGAHIATLAHERIEVEDTAVACLRFKNGALGVIQAATSVHPGLPKTVAIHGNQGTVTIEQDDLTQWDFLHETERDEEIRQRFRQKTGASGGASNPAAISHEGHARQLRDFVAALSSGGLPQVDGREGRRAVQLIEAIYRSAETGSFITLS